MFAQCLRQHMFRFNNQGSNSMVFNLTSANLGHRMPTCNVWISIVTCCQSACICMLLHLWRSCSCNVSHIYMFNRCIMPVRPTECGCTTCNSCYQQFRCIDRASPIRLIRFGNPLHLCSQTQQFMSCKHNRTIIVRIVIQLLTQAPRLIMLKCSYFSLCLHTHSCNNHISHVVMLIHINYTQFIFIVVFVRGCTDISERITWQYQVSADSPLELVPSRSTRPIDRITIWSGKR